MEKRATILYAGYCVSVHLEKFDLKVNIQYNGESTTSNNLFAVFNISGSLFTGACIELIKRFLFCIPELSH